MNLYVNQSVHINILRINTMANSAVLQIGSAGMIKAHSYSQNSGGFTKLAPKSEHSGTVTPLIKGVPIPVAPSG
ncbi:spore germination protein GerPB [Bacillus kwashiorkori]|uniref:spore germination protein GerPB n=1 Tax=Bacillus kwashiorkori TaxID=1522318 RepID=UPI000780B62A|nr:spore germination protein GerPB [Bacillus kwashiorkori]